MAPPIAGVLLYALLSLFIGVLWGDIKSDMKNNKTFSIDPRYKGETGLESLKRVLKLSAIWPLSLLTFVVILYYKELKSGFDWLFEKA